VTRNIFLIGNPVAGGGALKKIRAAEERLKNSGFNAEVLLTSKRGDAEAFARRAAAMPDTLVIAAGGDGTYNEVANGLLHSETPLAILPLGTVSVLARELGIPMQPEKALDIALNGRVETVNVGRIAFPAADGACVDGRKITRHFLLMAGLGYDGDAVYGINVKLKNYSGRLAYIFSGLNSIIKYRPDELEIEAAIANRSDIESGKFRIEPGSATISEGRLRATGYIAILGKAAAYGGNFSITPDAELKSPYLYVFLTHKKGKMDLIRLLAAIVTGKPLGLRHISYFRSDKITIKGSSRMQIDGDYAGMSPAKIDVVRNALKLVIPA
jgi:diacylglycerol kinase (ATP)